MLPTHQGGLAEPSIEIGRWRMVSRFRNPRGQNRARARYASGIVLHECMIGADRLAASALSFQSQFARRGIMRRQIVRFLQQSDLFYFWSQCRTVFPVCCHEMTTRGRENESIDIRGAACLDLRPVSASDVRACGSVARRGNRRSQP